MKTVLYLHGAFASNVSFKYIVPNLPEHNAILPNYSVSTPVSEIVDTILPDIIGLDSLSIVAHSFGGIVALLLAQKLKNLDAVITLSTPFGGSGYAAAMSWFVKHELFNTLSSNSKTLRSIHSMPKNFRMKSVITTVGNNPLMYEPNDGVVSIRSQKALSDVVQEQVSLNHFEVLMSDSTVSTISKFIFEN